MTEPSEAAYDRWSELRTLAGDSDIAGRRLVQQVSDAAKAVVKDNEFCPTECGADIASHLTPFMLSEPADPLVEALRASVADPEQFAAKLRDNLAKHGLKIVEASHDG